MATRNSRVSRVQGGWGTNSALPSRTQKVKSTSINENHPPQHKESSNLHYVGPSSSKAASGAQHCQGKIRNGLVVLRNFLDAETQRWLAEICFSMGDEASGTQTGNTGFYQVKKSAGGPGLFKLNMGTRGRMIDTTSSFPSRFSELCVECLRAAQKLDDTMPDMEPNTLLINFYKPNANFKWHKDSENPQLVKTGQGKPVISFSIGLSCDFGYKDHYEHDEHESVRLNSGDVFIFGGQSRMIVHSVLRVIPHTMPGYMRSYMREGRLNITFRLERLPFPHMRLLRRVLW